jgi:hypothetical protein
MNISLKNFLICCLLFLTTQVLVWFQLNGQFFSEWFKKNTFILSLFGIPVSYLCIYATNYGVKAFDGLLWPQRFLGFSIGIIIFAILSMTIMNETINFKTMLSLFFAFLIILVQIFIK